MNRSSETLSPVLYLPHGGGPLPLLGDANHEALVTFLKDVVRRFDEPSAILVISAHWEEDQSTITGGSYPGIIYDYYGFPEASYKIQYPAPGDPQLAEEVLELVTSGGMRARLDMRRGFDHGVFVPLKLMYPQAQIPCVQLSMLSSLDPAEHIALGKSLVVLRKKNVLIIGSGMSFHNLRVFFSPGTAGTREKSAAFDRWLIETCTSHEISPEERENRLVEWERAPFARFCHPREDHLLPLHVCYGAACTETPAAEVVFNQEVMGARVTGLLW